MRIVEAILRNQSTVLSVSHLVEDYYGISDVCLSLPALVNRGGVQKLLRIELSEQEVEQLQHSADVLKRTLGKLALAAA
jgi:L-lactate dehydrogenase